MREEPRTPEGGDATPDDAPTEAAEHSGSRWEPGDDEELTAEHAAPAPTPRPAGDTAAPARPRRRKGLLVAAGVAAAVVLAGGGFGAGYAVADSGPGGGDASIGHHRGGDRDGDGPGRTAPAVPGTLLGGPST